MSRLIGPLAVQWNPSLYVPFVMYSQSAQSVGADGIGCDACGAWFHPTPLCTGLSSAAINVIQTEGGDAIAFKCSQCRLRVANQAGASASRNSNSELEQTVSQVFQMVRSLAVAVAELSNTVKTLSSLPQGASANNSATILDRKELYSELFEFEERKKRSKSIIVRGVEAQSNDEFVANFEQVCNFLAPEAGPPAGQVVCISREKKLYRVTFSTKDTKQLLVNEAKKLKDHETFSMIYISRDLTYSQRQELAARRAEAGHGRRENPSNANRRNANPPSSMLSFPNNTPLATGRGGISTQPPRGGGRGRGRGATFH